MLGSAVPTMNRSLDDIEETLPREAASSRLLITGTSPVLFVAFFCDSPLEVPSRHALAQLSAVAIGRGRTRAVRRDPMAGTLELTLPDPWASSEHARLTR